MNKLKKAISLSAIDTIEKIEPGVIRRRFCFDDNFIGFSGHFPGYPLLPAFIQIMTGVYVVEDQFGSPVDLNVISKAKFLQQIRPGQEIAVECRDSGTGDKKGSDIRISGPDGLSASFHITYS